MTTGELTPARWSVRRPDRRAVAAVVAAALAVGYLLFRGQQVLPHDSDAAVFRSLNAARDWVDANRNSEPVFTFVVNYLRYGVALLVTAIQDLLGWLGVAGVITLAVVTGAVLAGWRIAVLAGAGFVSFGLLGLWQESLDTLALTLAAVLLAVAVGVPLGILAAQVRVVRAVLRPVLDVMQIMPTFAYLAPMTLLFLIGAPSATLATLIYAIPPAIRITALGISQVDPNAVQAATSLGSTRWQLLRKVRLPMARPTIILAVNQTLMMALSMVVITALIDAPGLGQPIMRSLERVNVGAAFDAGLAIVIMAVVLDRLTTRAAQRAGARSTSRTPAVGWRRWRRPVLLAAGVSPVVAALAVPGDGGFPDAFRFSFAPVVNTVVAWIELELFPLTDGIKNAVTIGLVNPLQTVLTSAPWWLLLVAVVLLGGLVSGARAAVVAGTALAAVAGLGLWQHAMETLATVLVATALTVVIGLWIGVTAARRRRFAAVARPVLDAAQTLPSFVYLLPAVALFGASRFTAVVAAVIYAVPPVARLVEGGVRAVPAPVVEAATAAGASARQLLWQVQLPIARRDLLLAANQGIVMVLAMVVVGGLVGAGALGYDVVAGFSQRSDFGQGLAAGACIVLLGVVLDRLTQGAGRGPAERGLRPRSG
ncbi:ABC transporter permease subunit [Micromonospora sp. NPDC049891]|uniref:ABC transporter permease subunit n=1 Tax=Micromonospora sp. NPDC049891 TaxID=3155655 RepID=UPI0033ECB97C